MIILHKVRGLPPKVHKYPLVWKIGTKMVQFCVNVNLVLVECVELITLSTVQVHHKQQKFKFHHIAPPIHLSLT